jgi:ATP-binding cassette, subfamily B, multidrug efflux pump
LSDKTGARSTSTPRFGFRGSGGRFGMQMEKPKDAINTIKRIWKYLGSQGIGLMTSIVLVLLTSLLGLLGPYYIGVIIDEYIIPHDVNGSIQMILLLAGIYLLTTALTWLQTYIMINIAQKTINQLRFDLFVKLQSLSLRFFDNRPHGDLMSRVTNDIDNLNSALSQSVTQVISSIISICGVIIAMFSLNWILATITLLIVPLMILSTKKIYQYSSSSFIKRQQDIGDLNGFVEEKIQGAEVVTLYGKEAQTIGQFNEINDRLRQSGRQADTFSGFINPIINFINNLGLGLVIGAGALLVLQGSMTVGVIASFVSYSRQFSRPISQIATLLNTIQSAIAGGERVFEIMDEVPEIMDKKNALAVERFAGQVDFKRVSFGYSDNQLILKDIHLQAKPGEMIALVGPTGSGKTTIVNLLTRFYDIQFGQIYIDGKNIKDYRIDDLRKRIAIVLQDTYLFSGTILENIRYGRQDASDEEVKNAAKMAWAHYFIKHLPKQYESEIMSGGTNLSQGQRQLIAIARAILMNADILILDEATSNIDTRTELHIQRGLKNLMTGRTSFVIAHRLKTIENADKILVVHQGEVIEQGTHEKLMDKRGFYHELYAMQFGI